MALVILCGIPGSGKTTLAHNLKLLFESVGKECVIVSEPSVEEGAFSSTRREITSRSDFKSAVHRELVPERVVIADGMNFIKGLRYELWCFARELGLGFCCVFCEASLEEAQRRSKDRYSADILNDLINRMEIPNERHKFDRPLVVIKDANDKQMMTEILKQSLCKSSKLFAKKATSKVANSSEVNEAIDRTINEFTAELLQLQDSVPLGVPVVICGAHFVLKKKYNAGQLKRAKREFGDRAKGLSDASEVAQLFADSLSILH